MKTIKTNLKEVLEISPYLWEYQTNRAQIKAHVLELINDGLEASEVIHQTRLWLANGRKPIEALTTSRKPEAIKNHSVRLNIGGTINLKDTLKLPPYRRGEKAERRAPILHGSHTIKSPSENFQLRAWILSLPVEERADFSNWCVKQGKVVSKSLWNEYKKTTSHTASAQEMELLFEQRAYVDDGWTKAKVRKAQDKFRHDVLINWNGRCAITGSRFAVEACHLISHASGGVPSVENGIALAADLHYLLDNGHLEIINNRAVFSDEAKDDPRYEEYHQKKLRTPAVPIKII